MRALLLAAALALTAAVLPVMSGTAYAQAGAAQAPSVTSACSAGALSITTTGLPGGTVGTAYSQAVQVNAFFPPYTLAVVSGALPPGLALSSLTAVLSVTISGTPTTPGTYDFTIQATDQDLDTADQSLSITITQPGGPAAPLKVYTASLRPATTGTAYSESLGASGGTQPYTWSVISGSLPPGLSFCDTTGTLWGTPTNPGNYVFTAQVTDSAGATASQSLSISVGDNFGLSFVTTSLPGGTVGTAYSQAVQVNGFFPPFMFAIASGALPPGLALSSLTAVLSVTISGTPTTPGTYDFTIQVTDQDFNTVYQALSITVSKPAAALTVTTASLPAGTVGTGYAAASLAAAGGTAPYTWSLANGTSLPPGLALDSASGAIAGTPTTRGTYGFTAQVTDAAGATATGQLSITVNPASTGTTCTTTITGAHTTPLTVTSGVTCLTGATQKGNVTVDAGAGLIVTSSTVNGTVTATGAATVDYCGSTQSGTLTVTGTTGAVTLGDGGPCAADTVPSLVTISRTAGAVTVNGMKENGTLTLSGNAGGLDLANIRLSGLAYVQNNAGTAPVTVSGNAVNGSLYCTGNTPPPGDGGAVNTVAGSATGQCAGLAER